MIYQVHFGIHDGVLVAQDYSLPGSGRGFTGGVHPYAKFAPLYHLKFSRWGALAKLIRESKEDSFIFILIKHNATYKNFLDWVKREKMEEYIMCHFPEGVTNPNYKDNGRTLVPVVMCSKEHMWREQLKGNHEE